ncbi:hypothetical protein [Paenibacillus illinoisensis]|uniref:hypothetical protein n=1 Tax=Paenibacillus illinoisensis TaxID=59845 RepID=UPI001C8D99C1|nr:hypothetical protein [Paenibacillus illinoisensis]MBY0217838.1 hypothetical protein [Paenibacillus illinoisensis]
MGLLTYFIVPTLRKSVALITETGAFQHIHQGALYASVAAANFISIIEIENDFDFANSYTLEELFPNKSEFNNALFEMKDKFPKVDEYKNSSI